MYPLSYGEWKPIGCIIRIMMQCMHTYGKQLQYEGRSLRSLAKIGILFYDHIYYLTDRNNTMGYLEGLPLKLEWNYIDWPILELSIMESIKSKLYKYVQRYLWVNISTHRIKLSLFIPITFFFELFYYKDNVHSPTFKLCVFGEATWWRLEQEGIKPNSLQYCLRHT